MQLRQSNGETRKYVLQEAIAKASKCNKVACMVEKHIIPNQNHNFNYATARLKWCAFHILSHQISSINIGYSVKLLVMLIPQK